MARHLVSPAARLSSFWRDSTTGTPAPCCGEARHTGVCQVPGRMEDMPQPLADVLAEVRALLLGPELTRAVAAGRRRGHTPSVTRAEIRAVALKAGPKLQIITDDGNRPYTRNVTPGAEAAAAIDALLAEPFGNW